MEYSLQVCPIYHRIDRAADAGVALVIQFAWMLQLQVLQLSEDYHGSSQG